MAETPDQARVRYGLRPLTLRERLANVLEPDNRPDNREPLEVGDAHPDSDRERSNDDE